MGINALVVFPVKSSKNPCYSFTVDSERGIVLMNVKKSSSRLEAKINIKALGKYYEYYIDHSSLLFMNEEAGTVVPCSP